MGYDIFLVDVDDTILDFHGAAIAAVQAAFERCALEWKDGYAEEYTRFNASLWAQLERKEITREYLHATRFPRFLQLLGVENADGDLINELYEEFIMTRPQYFRGAKEFLNALNERGRVYFLTNGTQRIQRARFDAADLWKYADATFISGEAGADKPAKQYTDYVLERIPNFEKGRALWIGDSLTADIRAALNAEIDCVWFNPQGKEGKEGLVPTYEVKDYSQILQILGE
jgi:YjjG family noncanonical pyrimidine nucleotidase